MEPNGTEEGAGIPLLTPQLMAQLGVSDASQVISVGKEKKKQGRKGVKRERVDRETRELANTLSKAKQKKLKHLEDRKAKEMRRTELYRRLQEQGLAPGQLSLLQSSKTVSQNQVTSRIRLKRAVQQAVAGMTLEEQDVADDLRSHPNIAADIEELLGLPLGGALAAVEKVERKGPVAPDVDTGGNGVRVCKGKAKREPRGPVSARSPPPSVGNGTTSTTKSPTRKKEQRPAVESSVPSQAPAQNGTADSSDDSSSSSDGDEGKTGNNGHPKPLPGKAPIPVTPPAAADGDGLPAVGKDSGASWAVKMMSSLSALQSERAKSAEEPGQAKKAGNDTRGGGRGGGGGEEGGKSERGNTLFSKGESASAGDGPNGDDQDSSNRCSSMGDNRGGNRGDIRGDSPKPKEETVKEGFLYPPPPKWLSGDMPTYQATETPLLTAAREGRLGGRVGVGTDTKGVGSFRQEKWVPVSRPPEAQAARMALPVCGMEQEIVEAVYDNDVVVLCGETGSGKSTQVPQFLYEAGYARGGGVIGVTQPRRVAAVSTARRVAQELGTACGRRGSVAYQIRHDSSGVGAGTRIKFMTDGVLLREITSDLLLRKYSVVLLDEAHERNLNTDVLLGMLSRSLPLRRQAAEEEKLRWDMTTEDNRKTMPPPLEPLKLIIMSATLRVSDFTENRRLFPAPPPVITVRSRQHPVTVHFSRRTELYDYLGETFSKVCKIHRRLPDGGILVFLTGKREIQHMCQKLRREFPAEKAPRGAPGEGEVLEGGEGTVGKERTRPGNDPPNSNLRFEEDRGGGRGPRGINGHDEGGESEEGTVVGTSLGDPMGAATSLSGEKMLFRGADEDEQEAEELMDEDTNPGGLEGIGVGGEGGEVGGEGSVSSGGEEEQDLGERSEGGAHLKGVALLELGYLQAPQSSIISGLEKCILRSSVTLPSSCSGLSNPMVSSSSSLFPYAQGLNGRSMSSPLHVYPPPLPSLPLEKLIKWWGWWWCQPRLSCFPSPPPCPYPNPNPHPDSDPDRSPIPLPPGDDDMDKPSESKGPPDRTESESGAAAATISHPTPLHVVPLYAMLTAQEQAEAFRPPPQGTRLVVVATNVAETSVTIPGVAYVVDCGREKRRVVQRESGISTFEVGWISRASADQRAGRAGRTGPGHCYRLYSSALYSQQLEPFALPEVLTRPLEDVVLQMKAMGIQNVSTFPFPTPPDGKGLRAASNLLVNLGAVGCTDTSGARVGEAAGAEGGGSAGDGGAVTPVGRAMALLPVGVRYAKMLLLAKQGGVLEHGVVLVAMLTEGNCFVQP
ncbi:unnamed protein product, partial [Discosporangium mesarthrocarpum]